MHITLLFIHWFSMFRDVAAIVSEKTVNPENNRPYTVSYRYFVWKRAPASLKSYCEGDNDSKCDEADSLFRLCDKDCEAAGMAQLACCTVIGVIALS